MTPKLRPWCGVPDLVGWKRVLIEHWSSLVRRWRRWTFPELIGAFHEIDHMGCRLDREGMWREIGSWRNVASHFTGEVQLPIGCAASNAITMFSSAITRMRSCTKFGIGQFSPGTSLSFAPAAPLRLSHRLRILVQLMRKLEIATADKPVAQGGFHSILV